MAFAATHWLPSLACVSTGPGAHSWGAQLAHPHLEQAIGSQPSTQPHTPRTPQPWPRPHSCIVHPCTRAHACPPPHSLTHPPPPTPTPPHRRAVYGVLPSSVLFLVLYSWGTQRFSRERLFNIILGFFVAFYAGFGLLYPSHEALHLDVLGDAMVKVGGFCVCVCK